MRKIELLLKSSAIGLEFWLSSKKPVHGSFTFGASTIFEIGNYKETVHYTNHKQALRGLIDHLHRNGHIDVLRDITAVVHRFSHGGDVFTQTTKLHRESIAALHAISHLSPDMPASILTLKAALSQLPSAKHIGVFDTAFTSSLPPEARSYAISPKIAKEFRLARYGYHGIWHKGAYEESIKFAKKKYARVVSVIIDDDVSVTAIRNGIALETTTGLTQAEGLPGLYRSGSVDPRIPLHLAAYLQASPQLVDKVLSSRSGIAALTGKDSYDAIIAAAKKEHVAAIDALMLLSYRISQSVAGMSASLGGIDMIIFSGNGCSRVILDEVCRRLAHFDVKLAKKKSGLISTPRSVKVIVLQTSEHEYMLREAKNYLQ